MLNTDLHNVNIKEEKKMSLKDFYRNNKNYGADVSKGIDLPEDFLTGIYNGIKTFPFRTLKDGPEGEITPERWGDLLRMNAVMRAAENSIFKRPATTDWSAAAAVYTSSCWANSSITASNVNALSWLPCACLPPLQICCG